MKGILGIVNIEKPDVYIEGLSDYRTIPAMSFLGRYRVVDVVLSNMVNSGIKNIKVLTRNKSRSLIEHLGNGYQYDISPKTGSLQVVYTDIKNNHNLYYNDVALLNEYKTQLIDANEDYVAISPSYMISTLDYREVIKQHQETNAAITVVYTEVESDDARYIGCDEIEFFENEKRIKSIKTSFGPIKSKNLSLETYVMSKSTLLKLLDNAKNASPVYTIRDYIITRLKSNEIIGYKYEGFIRCINSLNSYFDIYMELLDRNTSKELFKKGWPIMTKTNDSAPSFYSPHAKVTNCMIANGCAIQGEVENCIIGRGAKIKRGAVVKNSIIAPYSIIGRNTKIEYAVIDKRAEVLNVKEVIGTKENIAYIKRRDKI